MAKKSAKEKLGIIKESEVVANIIVDFSCPTCWVSTKIDDFVNFFKDDQEIFYFHNQLFSSIIPAISKCQFSNMHNKVSKHCHIINERRKVDLVKKIFISLYMKEKQVSKNLAEDYYNQNFNEAKIYQIGVNGSLRLFGVKEGYHHFKVLFMDYHHLFFSNVKYNDDDYDSYSTSIFKRGNEQ